MEEELKLATLAAEEADQQTLTAQAGLEQLSQTARRSWPALHNYFLYFCIQLVKLLMANLDFFYQKIKS